MIIVADLNINVKTDLFYDNNISMSCPHVLGPIFPESFCWIFPWYKKNFSSNPYLWSALVHL